MGINGRRPPKEMEKALYQKMEDNLTKNGRRPKKNGRRPQAQFKKSTLIGCDIIVI
jgi:hypothetical protein